MGENWLRNAGEKPGVRIWRIDNRSQELSNVGEGSYGVFRSDDCYLVLNLMAYTLAKASDLEETLGRCTTSREIQDHESRLFQNLFRMGIQYVEPLTLQKQSNLREEDHPTRLYHLKGRRTVRVHQVEVGVGRLNSGDVFILDTDTTIYQWNGKEASRMEKGKALDMTVRLRDERMNRVKAEVVIVDEGKETEQFWAAIGGKGEIASASSAGSDEEFESSARTEHRLYRVSDASGTLTVTQVDTAGQPLAQSHLDPNDSFILDVGTDIFVWTGIKATNQEKREALSYALKFLKETGRPSWTPVTKVSQGVEPALFKAHFRGPFTEYIDTPDAFNKRVAAKSKVAGTLRQEKVNVDAMHHPEKYAIAREELNYTVPGKGYSGAAETEFDLWYVKEKKTHPLPEIEYGIFYSQNSYVIKYSVRMRTGGWRHIVYYWQGRSCSIDDKGSSALLAQEISQSYGRSATLVRVIQNKEPEHFLSHFQGYMTVRKGHRETWTEEHLQIATLYQVRGTTDINAVATQVESAALSLNSNDTFVLFASSKVFVWEGKGSNLHERVIAKGMIDKLKETGSAPLQIDVFEEGSESDAFWSALGGKSPYSNDDYLITRGDIGARLFQCTDRTGVFKVCEVYDFTQDDLDDDDVMLLDGYHEIFVWLGHGATNSEKENSKSVALEYVRQADDGRDKECPVYIVHAGSEPLAFTVYFRGWDYNRQSNDVYSRRLIELKLEDSVVGGFDSSSATSTVDSSSVVAQVAAPPADSGTQFPGNPSGLIVKPPPDGVDGSQLEAYLSEAQFSQFLKMSRAEFYAQPKWKQVRIRKSAGLF